MRLAAKLLRHQVVNDNRKEDASRLANLERAIQEGDYAFMYSYLSSALRKRKHRKTKRIVIAHNHISPEVAPVEDPSNQQPCPANSSEAEQQAFGQHC